MKTRMKKDRQGFTIIEVVLVLAIAGLIFLMIFIALPALQRSQRDAQRRNDISLLLTKIMNYQTNNRGALPAGTGTNTPATVVPDGGQAGNWALFHHDYLNDNFRDPNGEPYALSPIMCGASTSGDVCKWDYSEVKEGVGPSAIQIAQEYKMKNKILINVGATCNGETAVQSNNPRKVAAQYFLEGAGVYCANT